MFLSPKVMKTLKEVFALMILFVIFSWLVNIWRAPHVGNASPALLSGKTLSGRPVREILSRNEPVLIHFWATWCPICRQESSTIESLAKDLPLLTIAVQSGDDYTVQQWMKERNLHYPVLNDPRGEIASRFGISVYPTTLIYDTSRRLRFAETGYTTSLGLLTRMKWVEFIP